jgi:hypothetical protein
LYDPITRWGERYIEMQSAAAVMFDREEAIQRPERKAWNREEVQRREHFAVIVQESKPLLSLALLRSAL